MIYLYLQASGNYFFKEYIFTEAAENLSGKKHKT